MLKSSEIANLDSCFHRALDDERMFVLLARDPAAPATIRFWVEERIRLGKSSASDKQIKEALDCASLMDIARDLLRERIALEKSSVRLTTVQDSLIAAELAGEVG